MNWKNCLLAFTIIATMLAFMCYLIFTVFVIPAFAECDSIGQYYDDSPVNLCLGEWMFGNMIAGIIILSLMVAMSKSKDSAIGFLMAFCGLYCLFEVVWNIIGFMIFNHGYKDACASSGSFNTYITAGLYYGILLFPLIIILSITATIQILKDVKKSKAAVPQQQLN